VFKVKTKPNVTIMLCCGLSLAVPTTSHLVPSIAFQTSGKNFTVSKTRIFGAAESNVADPRLHHFDRAAECDRHIH